MKKTLLALSVIFGVSMLGAGQAHAIPVIDGSVGGAEWSDTGGYAFYRQSNDSFPDAGVRAGTDIVRATILQVLDGTAASGIYVSIETLGPIDFSDADPGSPFSGAFFALTASVIGDATPELVIVIEKSGIFHDGAITASVVFSSFPFDGTTGDITTEAGTHASAPVGTLGIGTGLEFFIPSGAFGSPPIPFPGNFIGHISADDGASGADDDLDSLPVPEPSTMMLFGAGLLGLIGFRRFRS